MAKQAPTSHALSPDSLQSLHHHATLLHLLHYRNRNQHRRSPWYRHFSLFRRHLSRLLPAITHLSTPPPPSSTHLVRTQWKSRLPALQAWVDTELALWTEVLVPKWSRAFSQVVADGRFGVIGVVLVGVLAGCCGVLGVMVALEELGQREVEEVLEEFGREAGELGSGDFAGREEDVQALAVGKGEAGMPVARDGGDEGEVVAGGTADEGEVVAREAADEAEVVQRDATDDGEPVPRQPELQDTEAVQAGGKISRIASLAVPERARATPQPIPSEEEQPDKKKAAGTKRRADPKTKPSSKKKRKKGDAIDQLFSGL